MTTVLLAVGTDKGLFLGTSEDRARGAGAGRMRVMARVAAVGLDTRRSPVRILMGGRHEHWGPVVMHSDDLGETWVEDERAALRFPADAHAAVAQVWQLQPGPPRAARRGVGRRGAGRAVPLDRRRRELRAGSRAVGPPAPTDLATRLRRAVSAHGAAPPDEVRRGARRHLHRWGVPVRRRRHSWAASNAGIEARFQPDRYPEYGQCVHKVVRDCADPDRLYLQNHGGVFTSDDDGSSWGLVTAGLPADFGFGLVAHPTAPVRRTSSRCRPMRTGCLRAAGLASTAPTMR